MNNPNLEFFSKIKTVIALSFEKRHHNYSQVFFLQFVSILIFFSCSSELPTFHTSIIKRNNGNLYANDFQYIEQTIN